jgi:hypothetical protein
MYEAILHRGLSDSRAALLVKVSTSTVSRWKQEDPRFADFLETARAKFELTQIKEVTDTPARNAYEDARKAKWLLQSSNPERWGRPGKLPGSAPRRRGRPPRR